CILINPIFSLKDHLEMEKEHKFFYKKFLKELADAYNIDIMQVELEVMKKMENFNYPLKIPMKIMHIMTDRRSYNLAKQTKNRTLKWIEEGIQTSICYLLPEKKQGIESQIVDFMKQNERIL
ncbi:hydrolase, partial [Bacillus sp. JJ1532]